jgi:hypothetical protein
MRGKGASHSGERLTVTSPPSNNKKSEIEETPTKEEVLASRRAWLQIKALVESRINDYDQALQALEATQVKTTPIAQPAPLAPATKSSWDDLVKSLPFQDSRYGGQWLSADKVPGDLKAALKNGKLELATVTLYLTKSGVVRLYQKKK